MLSALFPSRIYIYIAAAIAIFASGGTVAYKVQSWRIDNIQSAHAKLLAESAAKVAAAESANQLRIIEAQNVKTKREIVNKNAAAGAHSALYSLHSVTSAYIAKTSPSACNERAEAVTAVFGQCTDALTDLAETADRLDSDRQLLLDAWPQ